MTTNTRPSLRSAVNAKCKECVYDPLARGNWREQVAVCGCANCPLYETRPVPRDCVANGRIDAGAVARISAKLSPRH